MPDKKQSVSQSVSEEDAALFRSQVKGATPIKSDRVLHKRSKPSTLPASAPSGTNAKSAPLDDNFDSGTIDANTALFFSHPGLQRNKTKRLKRGEFGIDDRLDLHGLKTAQAKRKLRRFLTQSQQHGKRCVLIIHGRGLGSENGKAVLKQAINHWLPQLPEVMAFCSALERDGGRGAVYVLLRQG